MTASLYRKAQHVVAPLLLLALPILASACNSVEESPEPPDLVPTKPVIDSGEVLSESDEKSLNIFLTRYFDRSGTAIVVTTVKSLEGQSIEAMAKKKWGQWGIGDMDTHRGLLILVAPNEKQARIEVGCGLEMPVTNAAAKGIIEETLIPRFAKTEYSEGINAGVRDLVDLVDNAPTSGPTSDICKQVMGEAE